MPKRKPSTPDDKRAKRGRPQTQEPTSDTPVVEPALAPVEANPTPTPDVSAIAVEVIRVLQETGVLGAQPPVAVTPCPEVVSTAETGTVENLLATLMPQPTTTQPKQGMFRPLALPLGSTLNDKLKSKIWSGEFVEMSSLLEGPEAGQPTTTAFYRNMSGHTSLAFSTNEPRKKELSLEQWTDTFIIFISIYLEKSPLEVSPLLKYMHSIRGLAYTTNIPPRAWAEYDTTFRKSRHVHGLGWGDTLWELYFSVQRRAYTLKQTRPSQDQSTSSVSSGSKPGPKLTVKTVDGLETQIPRGHCYKYAQDGTCDRGLRCNFKHTCAVCQKPDHHTARH